MIDIEEIDRLWEESSRRHPVVQRLLPWARSLLDAARLSAGCGLPDQADRLAEHARDRLERIEAIPVPESAFAPLTVQWDPRQLPSPASDLRRENLSRRVRRQHPRSAAQRQASALPQLNPLPKYHPTSCFPRP